MAEVEARLDAEFQRRVEEESERKAAERLTAMVNQQWPHWYAMQVEPKIRLLETVILENVFKMLEGPWEFTCINCGEKTTRNLTSSGITELVQRSHVQIDCPNCGHKRNYSLEELIQEQIQGTI